MSFLSLYFSSDWFSLYSVKESILFKKYSFIYLAVSGLSWGTRDLCRIVTGIFHCGSRTLVVPCGLSSWGLWVSCSEACGILVPQPGIEPVLPAVEAYRLKRWAIREVPLWQLVFCFSVSWGACLMAYGILVPQLWIEPVPTAVEGQSLNHWPTREVWRMFLFIKKIS